MCKSETKEEIAERLEEIEMPQLPATAPTGGSLVQMMLVKETFEQLWRVGKLFADSSLVPEALRGKPGDCMIALTMADALQENPVTVMQNIYFVHGKPGWQAQYMIAKANQSGVFKGGIKWRQEGEGDSLKVTAYATLAEDDEEVNFTVSMKMAKAEGWTSRSGNKYGSMPELMLRYRSATLLVRLYAPHVMMGMHTVDEIRDTLGSAPKATVVQKNGHDAVRAAVGLDREAIDAEVEEVDPDPVGANPFPAPAAK